MGRGAAAEWRQRDVIDPARMPLTRLANTIIDEKTDASERRGRCGKYSPPIVLGRLLLRADRAPVRGPGPVLDWVREALGARFVLGQGAVFCAVGRGACGRGRGCSR